MTRAEWWLTCQDADELAIEIVQARHHLSDRKAYLICAACCSRIAGFLPIEVGNEVLEVVIRYADDQAEKDELREARRSAEQYGDADSDYLDSPTYWATHGEVPDCLVACVNASLWGGGDLDQTDPELQTKYEEWRTLANTAHLAIVRDVCGNPFRPVSVDPAWLTSTVRTLAENIYADCAFDRLPILAHALQDAGCDNEDILNHCRGDGPHVRGCWVVDLLTGRK